MDAGLFDKVVHGSIARSKVVDHEACEIYFTLLKAAWDTGRTPLDVADSLRNHVAEHPTLVPEIANLERMGPLWLNYRGDSYLGDVRASDA